MYLDIIVLRIGVIDGNFLEIAITQTLAAHSRVVRVVSVGFVVGTV